MDISTGYGVPLEGDWPTMLHALKEFRRATTSAAPGSVIDVKSRTADLDASAALQPTTTTVAFISKFKSKKMMQALWGCTDLIEARRLIAPVMKRFMHCGKGLCERDCSISCPSQTN